MVYGLFASILQQSNGILSIVPFTKRSVLIVSTNHANKLCLARRPCFHTDLTGIFIADGSNRANLADELQLQPVQRITLTITQAFDTSGTPDEAKG